MTNEAPSNGWVVFDQVAIDLAGKRLFATKGNERGPTKGDQRKGTVVVKRKLTASVPFLLLCAGRGANGTIQWRPAGRAPAEGFKLSLTPFFIFTPI